VPYHYFFTEYNNSYLVVQTNYSLFLDLFNINNVYFVNILNNLDETLSNTVFFGKPRMNYIDIIRTFNDGVLNFHLGLISKLFRNLPLFENKSLNYSFCGLQNQIKPIKLSNIMVYDDVTMSKENNKKANNLDLAFDLWKKENNFNELNEGTITIQKFKGNPIINNPVTTQIEDNNIIYYGYQKSGVVAYDKISDQFYVLYKPWNDYWYPTALKKIGPYLFIGTNGDGLIVMNLNKAYLKKINLDSGFDKINSIEVIGTLSQSSAVVIRIYNFDNNKRDVAVVSKSTMDDKLKLKFTVGPTALEYYAQGIKFAKENQFQEAIHTLKKAILLKPDLGGVYGLLGYCYIQLNQFDALIGELEDNLLNRPDFFDAYYRLGFAYNRLNNYEKAIKNLREAIRLNSNDAYVYNELGWSYYHLSRSKEAIIAFQNALILNPDLISTYYYLGLSYLKEGEITQAERQYTMLVPKNKDMADKLNEKILEEEKKTYSPFHY